MSNSETRNVAKYNILQRLFKTLLFQSVSKYFCCFWVWSCRAQSSKLQPWALIYEWSIEEVSFVLLAVHDFQGFSWMCTPTSNGPIFVVIGSWASCKNVRRALVALLRLPYFWSPNAIAKSSKFELFRDRIFSIFRCWNIGWPKMAKWDRFSLSVPHYTFPLH